MALQWHPHVAPSNGTDIPTSVVAGLPHPPRCTNLYDKSLGILDIISHLVVCGSDTSVPSRSPRPHRVNEPRSHFVHVKYSFHLRKVMVFCTYTYLGSQFITVQPSLNLLMWLMWWIDFIACTVPIPEGSRATEWVKSWNHSLDSGRVDLKPNAPEKKRSAKRWYQRKTGIEFVKATGSRWIAVFATGMN